MPMVRRQALPELTAQALREGLLAGRWGGARRVCDAQQRPFYPRRCATTRLRARSHPRVRRCDFDGDSP